VHLIKYLFIITSPHLYLFLFIVFRVNKNTKQAVRIGKRPSWQEIAMTTIFLKKVYLKITRLLLR
jgi:hypothetical protein